MTLSNTSPDQQIWVTLNNGGSGFTALNRDNANTVATQFNRYQASAGVVHPNDIVFDTVHGLYFFADSVNGNRRVLQGNISDLLNPSGPPVLKVLYSDTSAGTAGGQIFGLAVDPDAGADNGAIYFVNKGNLDRVSYSHDGASTVNQTPSILATLPVGTFANEIALDIDHHQAFILSTASSVGFIEVPPETPGAEYDPDADAYFIQGTTVTNNEIWRVSGLDRTDSTIVDTTTAKLLFNGAQDLPAASGLLQSIDIDPTTNQLYFTTQQINSGVSGEVGGVYRYDVGAGTFTQLYVEGNSTDYSFEYIDVDPGSGKYYVSNLSFDDNTNANTSSVLVHDLSAGTPTQFASVGNVAGAVPQGLIIVNGPTLGAVESNSASTESAGAGSGFSLATSALATASAADTDTAGLHDQLAGATVRISSGFASVPGAVDRLTINGTTSGSLEYGDQDIAYSFSALLGVMTLTGASSFANYNAALALVSYSVSGDNPDGYGAHTTRTLAYSVTDGLLSSDEQVVTVSIAAVNDAPVNSTGGAVVVAEDSSGAVSGLAVHDPDANPASDVVSVTLGVLHGATTVRTDVVGGLGAGDVSGNGSGSVVLSGTQNAINATLAAANGVVYAPAANYNGSDTLTVVSNDNGHGGSGGAQSDSDTVSITVTPVNDAPTAPPTGSVSTNEDTASAATAIGASDIDADTLSYSVKAGFGAAHGSVSFDQVNGTFTYNPAANYNGSDSFTILVSDGNGGTAEQVVTVSVAPVNDAPTAPATGSVTTAEDSASAATSINASDVENDTLTYSVKAGFGAAHGSVSFNQAAGTFTYNPAANYNGSDSFTIVVSDGNGGSTEQVVSVNVTPVNDAPTAPPTSSVSTAEDTPSAATAIGASDVDNDTLTYSVKAGFGAAHGSVSFNQAAGTYTYNPASNYNGSDSFTILVSDGNGGTVEQAVSVSVSPVNDAPTGVTGSLQANEYASNGTAVGTVVGQDPDSSSFTYQLMDNAGGRFGMDNAGHVTVTDGLLLDYEQANHHTIQVKVTDDQGAFAVYAIDVLVNDIHGENVTGDARHNTFVGGIEADILNGAAGDDALYGGGGQDHLNGGTGNDFISGDGGDDVIDGGDGEDTLQGGLGHDTLTGGAGNDTFVLVKGEVDGDTIYGFFGRGAADGDSIELVGYAAGTTFTRIGNGSSTLWEINDHGSIEHLNINATGTVFPTDYQFL
jgi:VCBS repeat-containing protein